MKIYCYILLFVIVLSFFMVVGCNRTINKTYMSLLMTQPTTKDIRYDEPVITHFRVKEKHTPNIVILETENGEIISTTVPKSYWYILQTTSYYPWVVIIYPTAKY